MTATPLSSPPVACNLGELDTTAASDVLRRRVAVGLILLLSLLVRLRGLGYQSLWFDESVSAWIAAKPVAELIAAVQYWERTPPLHYLILRGFIVTLGDTEWVLRLPSVLAGVGAVWMTYLLGARRLAWRVGAAAALLMALSPYQVLYAHEARTYTLLEFLALASCYLFLEALDRSSRRVQAAYIVVTALMLYAHLYGILVVVVQNLVYFGGLLARGRPTASIRRWTLLQFGVAALFAPWLPTTFGWARSATGTFWVDRITADEITRAWWLYVGSGPALLMLASLAVVGGMAVLRRRMGGRRDWMLLSLLATLPVVLPVIVSVLRTPVFTPRYGIHASGALFLLAAAGLVTIPSRIVQIALLTCLAGLPLLRADPPIENSDRKLLRHDWRGAGAYLDTVLQPGDYVGLNAGGTIFLYGRYVGRRDVEVAGFTGPELPFAKPLRSGSRVWIVLHTPMTLPRDILAAGNWQVVSRRAFPDIDVWQLAPAPPREKGSTTTPAQPSQVGEPASAGGQPHKNRTKPQLGRCSSLTLRPGGISVTVLCPLSGAGLRREPCGRGNRRKEHGVPVAKKAIKKSTKPTAKPAAAASAKRAAAVAVAVPVKKAATRVATPAVAAKGKAKPAVVAKPPIKVAPVAPVVKPARRIVDNSPKPGSGPGPVIMARKRTKAFVNPPPPLAPVPTNGKPKKNQAGLNSRELEHFRELLLDKRRELVGDMSHMEREALRSASGTNLSNLPMHMADMGTDNYEQEFTLGLVENERKLLREINQALAKIQDGTYGICEGTGKPINKVRLEAQPWARYSIEHARQMERGFVRR